MSSAKRVKKILADRPKTHGDFTDGARFTQEVLRVAAAMPAYASMTAVQREGLHMIVHKLQRALAGDPDFAEHWHDVAGYANLVADRCSK